MLPDLKCLLLYFWSLPIRCPISGSTHIHVHLPSSHALAHPLSCSHLCHPPAPCVHTLRHVILACYPYLHNLGPQLINCCTIKLTLIPASTLIPMDTPAHLHSQLTPSPSPPHVHTHICDPAHTPSCVNPHNILTSALIHTYTRTDPHSFILTHIQMHSSSHFIFTLRFVCKLVFTHTFEHMIPLTLALTSTPTHVHSCNRGMLTPTHLHLYFCSHLPG